MRIHEILEQCVEYISFDGAIGSDPKRLIEYLTKLDPSLDQDYFTHLWTLLCAHPSIQIVLTNEPLLLPGGTVDLGTAPLPGGWFPPQNMQDGMDYSSLYKEGFRGRQIAYLLAGQEFRSDKQAIQDKREANKKKSQKAKQANLKRNKNKVDEDSGDEVKVDPSGAGILRVLRVDDSEEGDSMESVPKSDFRSLREKWGARLRIRCTEDEIYYRLTGSHAKVPKITSTVFHVLQLAAMSREKGITAIDLGPLVGASQGSMHYFMKVLVQLGLCAKVPAVLHASVTNLLVFHRHLDENPNYRALIGKPLKALDEEANPVQADEALNEGAEVEDQESGDETVDPSLDDSSKFTDWGYDPSPLSEAELVSGHKVKQRLLKMLDHPKLQNHLLRTKNLLPALGWFGHTVMRHRRALKRHIVNLAADGVLERVYVGETRTSCIRLSKYNPETAINVAEPLVTANDDVIEIPEQVHDLRAQAPYTPPLDPHILNIPLTITFEHWIIDLVLYSEQSPDVDQRGMTINALWRNTNYVYKRSIDFAILRADNAHIPEHLWSYSVSSFMETVKKERRLRLFTTAEFQRIMFREGQPIEGYAAMSRPDIAGHFGDISYKSFYASEDQLNRILDRGISLSANSQPPKKIGRPLKVQPGKSNSKPSKTSFQPVAAVEAEVIDESENEDDTGGRGRKDFKYSNDAQIRGRPRKYVHVVEEDGKVNRRIIGTVYSREDLPQVLVYLKDRNLLVTAPFGYSGVGPPPPVSEEAIKEGKPPEYYYQFPAKDSAAFSGLPGRKLKAKAEREAKAAMNNKADGNIVIENKNSKKGGKEKKGKKRAKGDGNSGSEQAFGTPSIARKSKRQKKDVNYSDQVDATPNQDDNINSVVIQDPNLHPLENGPEECLPNAIVPISDPLPVSDTVFDDTLVDPALIATPLVVPTPPEPEPEPIVGAQPDIATAEITTISSAPPVEKKNTPRQAKKRAKASKDPKVQVKQENVETPKRQRKAPKTKASEKGDTTLPLQDNTAVVGNVSGTSQTVNDPPPTSQPTHGSRFFPIDIPDETIFEQSMEASIGTVLSELSQSGVRPLPPPTAEAIAAVTASSVPTPTPLSFEVQPIPIIQTDSAVETAGGKGKKRKSTLSTSTETPSKSSRSKQGKTSTGFSKSTTPEAPADGDERQLPFFNLPQEPMMEEMPFQLPDDIFAITKSTSSRPTMEETVFGSEHLVKSPTPSLPASGNSPNIQAFEKPVDVTMPDTENVPPANHSEDPQQDRLYTNATPSRATPTPIPAGVDAGPLPQSITPLRESSAPMSTPFTPSHISRAASNTPLREITQPRQNLKILHAVQGPARAGRVDLGSIRRANELMQVLQDNGGALVDTKLIHEHRNWAIKYAGTDHPHAPASAYGMDRLVVKKTVNILLSDGRIKETIASVPTPTGRWVRTSILYLSDLPHEQLQAYIRQMSSNLSQSVTPSASLRKDKQVSAFLPATPYTELKSANRPAGSKMAVDATPTRTNTSGVLRPFSERRTALLKELKVVGQLFGWKASRCVRVQILHRAIIKALSRPDCGSVASTAPRIFAFPLLCEEITAEEWYSCCLVLRYNEEIENWLRNPDHRATKTKDVPKQFRPLGGFGGSNTKAKMNTLLQIMVALKIISPVTPVSKEEADFFADNAEHNGFKVEEHHVSTTWYLLHDLVPVYHIASLPPPLLGLLPARSEEEVDTLWSTIKTACVEMRVDILGRIGEQTKPGLPYAAQVSDQLDISIDHTKLLTRPKVWKSDLDLLPIQKVALDQVFDRTTGQSSIKTRQDLEDFAYENALPLPYLETEIQRRAEVARTNAAKMAERLREQAIKAQERQRSIQENIRQKLIERQELARNLWEDRVKSSAFRKNVDPTSELIAFISKQTIQSGSMKMSDANDSIIDHWVMIWEQIKFLPEDEQERFLEERKRSQVERVRSSAPRLKFTSGSTRRSSKKVKQPKTGPHKRVRSKRKWSNEDDDLILDAEAIIRARSRNNGYKGRQAMIQVFGDVVASTIRSRLSKIFAIPGKKAYFDRLEQTWFDIWMKIRNTEELVDVNPEDPIEFDLRDHIKVLRERIDKRSLRLLAVSTPTEDQEPAPALLCDSYQITEEYDWKYLHEEQHSFDQVADSISAEEFRINSIGSISLLDEFKLKEEVEVDSKDLGILQAAMKMVLATPDEEYDAARGQQLLEHWPSDISQIAIQDMLEKNVLRKLPTPSRDNERQYGFSQGWQQLNEGSFPPDLTEAAQALPPKFGPEEGIEWPLIGEPGELAALMNMVSNHEVDFDFDVHEFPTVKYEKSHFNTRKLDDDAYEFPLQVKRVSPPSSLVVSIALPDIHNCKPLTTWNMELPEDHGEIQRTVNKVIEAVKASSEEGISKPDLIDAIGCSPDLLDQVFTTLAKQEKKHQVFWTGYDTARLVSSEYWESWAIKVKPHEYQLPEVMISSRRWVDLYGEFHKEDFEEVVESVKSLIITRPGISFKSLRTKLSVILDRLELIEILEYLIKLGKIKIEWSSPTQRAVPPIEVIDIDEEDDIALFPVVDKVW